MNLKSCVLFINVTGGSSIKVGWVLQQPHLSSSMIEVSYECNSGWS